MKKNTHPKWVAATVVCACGSMFETGATTPQLRVEVCSKCHPYFTGQQRIVDTGGQIERFMRRAAKAQSAAGAEKAAPASHA